MCKFKQNWAQRILCGYIIRKGFEDEYNSIIPRVNSFVVDENNEHIPDSKVAKSADNNVSQIESSNKG